LKVIPLHTFSKVMFQVGIFLFTLLVMKRWSRPITLDLKKNKNKMTHEKILLLLSYSWTNIDYFIDVRIFIHELQNFGKRTSERSERVSLSKFGNEWIKIRTKHFLCCNLYILYIKKNKHFSQVNFIFLCTTRMTYNAMRSY